MTGRVAVWLGTVLRVLRAPARMLPGLLGAVLASTGLGGLAGHIWGRGLSPWVACTVAAGFLIWIGAEINAPPPRRPDSGS